MISWRSVGERIAVKQRKLPSKPNLISVSLPTLSADFVRTRLRETMHRVIGSENGRFQLLQIGDTRIIQGDNLAGELIPQFRADVLPLCLHNRTDIVQDLDELDERVCAF